MIVLLDYRTIFLITNGQALWPEILKSISKMHTLFSLGFWWIDTSWADKLESKHENMHNMEDTEQSIQFLFSVGKNNTKVNCMH